MKKPALKETRLKGGSGGARAIRVATIVLHVDDDPKDSELLRAAIQKANFACLLQQVQDGEQAIQYLTGAGIYSDRKRFPLPTLVLLDLRMPCLSGFEILKWIRANKAFRQLPVLMLSGSALQEDIYRAYEAGATSYLIKPLGFQALVKLMKDLKSAWPSAINALGQSRGARLQATL